MSPYGFVGCTNRGGLFFIQEMFLGSRPFFCKLGAIVAEAQSMTGRGRTSFGSSGCRHEGST